MFEGIGFGDDGEDWLKKAVQMIEKVKASPVLIELLRWSNVSFTGFT